MNTEVMEAVKFQIRGIPAPLIDKMWIYAEPYIKRALDHTSGELLHTDLKQSCKNRDAQLWLITQNDRVVAAVTTEIVNYPQRKHCRIITMGGSAAQEWAEIVDKTIMAWAKEQGCIALEAFVRRGFVKKLENFGYQHKYSVVTKGI